MTGGKSGKTTTGTRRRRKPAGTSIGLAAIDLHGAPPPDVIALERMIEATGGKALTAYRDPYGGHWLILAALPIDQVAPTPFQRNLSDTHAKKLEAVLAKIGRFLDPIIAVTAPEQPDGESPVRYWTPNGHHRLAAMRTLGAKSITAIVVPETAAAYQILALNTEKAHNLREKATEVIRMYRELAALGHADEQTYALEFEEPALITLGLCYEERPRFSGGAYHPVLKRVDAFLDRPLREALIVRRARCRTLLDLDDRVVAQVEALKARGMTSPYLKSFVVARLNPLRFRPSDAEPLGFDDALARMSKAAVKLDPAKIRVEDLARSGSAPDEG